MDFPWYLIESSNEISTEFPMDFNYWYFIENYIEF